MKLEGGSISPSQLLFLVMSFTLGGTLLRTPAAGAGHDGLLAILFGLAESLLFALFFTGLSLRFPGKTLVEFNDLIYGPFLGKLISLAYLFYFFLLATLVLRFFGDFFVGLIFPQTPLVILIGLLVLISASAVRNGIEVIARCSQILLPFTVVVVILTLLLSLPDMKFTNFLPILDLPLTDLLRISHYTATFAFGESVAFLMTLAFIGTNLKTAKKARFYLMLGLIGGGIILLITTIRNTGLLGSTRAITNYTSFQAVRLINIGEIFTRLEILVVINFLTMGFLAVSLLFYSTALGMAQIFKLRTYLPLVLPLGALLTCISIILFENILEYQRFSEAITPYFALPFQVGIPLLSLLICKIKGLPKG